MLLWDLCKIDMAGKMFGHSSLK